MVCLFDCEGWSFNYSSCACRTDRHGLFEKSIKVTVRRTAFSMGEDCTFDFIQYNILLDLFRVFGLMIRNVRSTSDYFRPFEAWRGLRCKRIR